QHRSRHRTVAAWTLGPDHTDSRRAVYRLHLFVGDAQGCWRDAGIVVCNYGDGWTRVWLRRKAARDGCDRGRRRDDDADMAFHASPPRRRGWTRRRRECGNTGQKGESVELATPWERVSGNVRTATSLAWTATP